MAKRKQPRDGKGRFARQKTWPNWMPLGGSHFVSGPDFYGREAPSPNQLIQAFTDTVYAAASLIADTVAATPIRLYLRTDPGQARPKALPTRPVLYRNYRHVIESKALTRGTAVEEVTSHEVLSLLASANSYHNRLDIFCLTELFLEITGNAFWLIDFDPFGVPQGLFLLPTQYVTPERDPKGMVTGWRFGTGTDTVVYKPEQVIHFKFPSLQDPYGWGYSPLEAAWNRVQIQFKEMGYLDATLTNFGRPDAILSPQEPISPFEAERLAKEFLHRFRGQGNGGVFVADGPMTVTPISWPAKDFAELQVYQTIKNSVAIAFHVPPDIFELGQANRASAEAVLFALAVHCIRPRICRLVEKLNERLVPYFSESGRLFFEADNVVPSDKEFERNLDQMLLQAGVITRGEVRHKYGYPDVPWADEPLLPPGTLPALAPELDQQSPGSAPEAPEPAPVDRSAQAPQIAALQQAYYSGQLPREAVVSNLVFSFGLTSEQAAALVPERPPVPPEGKAKALKATTVLDVPDVRQQWDFDCGPAAVLAVTQFFRVGTETEEDLIEALGTTQKDGTAPEAIIAYLEALGLEVTAQNDLTFDALEAFIKSGRPVIACIQDYETHPQQVAHETSGHYVVVIGYNDQRDKVTLVLQDPSAGRLEMDLMEFMGRWEDSNRKDIESCVEHKIPILISEGYDPKQAEAIAYSMCGEGKAQYTHFGIAVGRPQPGKGLKAHNRPMRLKSEKPLVEALQRFFRIQKAQVLGKIKATDPEQVRTKAVDALANWFDLPYWTDAMYEAMRPMVALYWDHASKQTVSRLGASLDLLKVVQPKIKEGIDKATLLFCEETNRTTSMELGKALEALRGELTEGVTAGEVQNQLMQRVQSIFEGAEVARAYKIAHSEASRGQHAAQELVATESGLVKGKKWLLSDDACPLCQPLSGKVVQLGEVFINDPAMGPYADVPYPPRHPLCRCTMLEVIE